MTTATATVNACPKKCSCHESGGTMAESPSCCAFMSLSFEGLSADAIEKAAREVEADGSVLMEAQRLVYGDRQRSYKHPYEDFTVTAAIWNAIGVRRNGLPMEPEDVGLLMIGVKMSRESHVQKRDNLVDIAGYAETVRRVLERKRELSGPSMGDAD